MAIGGGRGWSKLPFQNICILVNLEQQIFSFDVVPGLGNRGTLLFQGDRLLSFTDLGHQTSYCGLWHRRVDIGGIQ